MIISISLATIRKGELSQIKRALPPKAFAVIDNSAVNIVTDSIFPILCRDKFKDVSKVTSKEINDIIKSTLRKNVSYHPADKYPIDKLSFGDIRMTWHNLWRIKNPILRAIRLKILYKDVWCNDKRFRLGISSDDKCIICGETETVIHQLFLCQNAKRLWDIGHNIMGTGDTIIADHEHLIITKLIEVSPQIANEIIKSVIFKLLIQIDRSSNLNEPEIKKIIA